MVVRSAGMEERAGPAGGRQEVVAGRHALGRFGIAALPAGPRPVGTRSAPVGRRADRGVPGAGRRRVRGRRPRDPAHVPAPGDGQPVDGTAVRIRGRRGRGRGDDALRGRRTDDNPVERDSTRRWSRSVYRRIRGRRRFHGRSDPGSRYAVQMFPKSSTKKTLSFVKVVRDGRLRKGELSGALESI